MKSQIDNGGEPLHNNQGDGSGRGKVETKEVIVVIEVGISNHFLIEIVAIMVSLVTTRRIAGIYQKTKRSNALRLDSREPKERKLKLLCPVYKFLM